MLLAEAKDDILLKRMIGPLCIGVAFFIFQFLAESLTAQEHIADATIRFYDLTLPLISALLVLYRKKALPILGVFFLYSISCHPLSAKLTLTSQLLAALISQLLYYWNTGKRGTVSFGRSQLTPRRIGWLVCCNSVLYIIFQHTLQTYFDPESATEIFTVQTLINLQWMMNSCITGIPFCYLLLRVCHKPAWGLQYLRHVRASVKSGPSIFFISGNLVVFTAHNYVLPDFKKSQYAALYRLFFTVVIAGNVVGDSTYWACFGGSCMGYHTGIAGKLY